MRILVTGGAGFIGSHTCVTLIEKGYEIVLLDSYVNGHQKSIEQVIKILGSKKETSNVNLEIIEGDLRDKKLLEKIFLESKKSSKPIKAVLHFAGLKSVAESITNPLIYWDVNVNGAINLFNIMNKYNCRSIVFSSSATVYGRSSNMYLDEGSEINPINPYGRTKAVVEQLLNDIFLSSPESWRVANLRYFNPIGAHPSGLIGEAPNGIPNNIFPYLTQVAAGCLEKLTIFGSNWDTKDGTGIRDYIHVMDLAEGHIAALEYLLNNRPQIISLNLGTGLGTSVLDLIKTFEAINKVNIPYEFSSRRKGDVGTVIADNSKALSLIDWQPKRSLKEMCLDGWRWQYQNPRGYN